VWCVIPVKSDCTTVQLYNCTTVQLYNLLPHDQMSVSEAEGTKERNIDDWMERETVGRRNRKEKIKESK